MWSSLVNFFRQRPLSAKTTLRVMLFSFIITLASTSFLTWSEHRDELSRLINDLDNTIGILQPSLSHSIWSIDTVAIQSTLEGLLKYPGVYNASLVTSIDSTFTVGAPPQGETSLSRTYPMLQQSQSQMWLGDLTLLITLEPLEERMFVFFWRTLTEQFIKFFLVAGFMLLVVRFLVFRHLERLADYSQQLLQGRPPGDMTLERDEPIRKDEFTVILQSMRHLYHELEVQIRHREDSERLSHQERAEAIQSSHNKSLFIANISHELRTPMNNILGYSGLLMDIAQTEEQKEYISAVQQSSESLLTMLNDMLDLSKLESGALESEPEATELKQLMQEAIANLAKQADAKNLNIESYVDAAIPKRVIVDRVNLLRILECLLSVAISLTVKGQVVLHVIPLSSNDNKLMLRMAVEDNGAGLGPEDKRRILANTFEAATAESLPEVGVGLKLALARELIELLGGQFGIESQVGKGSTFWFETESELISAEHLPTISEDSVLQVSHVLVADTNELGLRTIIEQFGEDGRVQIDVAKSLPEAQQLLLQVKDTGQAYDAFILDESIADNEDVARDQIATLVKGIREQSEHKHTPVLIYSAHPQPENIAPYKGAGASAYLSRVGRDSQAGEILSDIVSGKRSAETFVVSTGISRAADQAPVDSDHPTVLLVEDNEVNRNLARKMLEKCGCCVELAENGEVALKQLAEQRYDMVFMDCWMPVLDGYDTTRKIRSSNQNFSEIPIVALTANAFAGEKQKCFEAGMNEFLTKPIRFEELAGIVRRFRDGGYHQHAS